jgi:hypothetical protein
MFEQYLHLPFQLPCNLDEDITNAVVLMHIYAKKKFFKKTIATKPYNWSN